MKILLLLTIILSLIFEVVTANSLEYEYSYVPKKVFKNQIFPITILTKKDINSSQKPNFIFGNIDGETIKPILRNPLIEKTENTLFYTFYFKAKNKRLIPFNVWIRKRKKGSDLITLDRTKIKMSELKAPENINFSGVIASKLKIKTSQVLKFDDRNNIVYITVEGQDANLEDMKIPNIRIEKIGKVNRDKSTTIIKYSFTIPSHFNRVTFSYFNSIRQKFTPVFIDTEYSLKSMGTQVKLNPKDNSFTKLKKYTFALLSLFFIIMYVIYRDGLYLILFIVTIVTLLRFFAPLNKVCIKEGAKIYILPIENSTVSKESDKQGEYPIYNRYKNYSKIEYENETIGWVKDEDLCQN